jgi:hypothetical protein
VLEEIRVKRKKAREAKVRKEREREEAERERKRRLANDPVYIRKMFEAKLKGLMDQLTQTKEDLKNRNLQHEAAIKQMKESHANELKGREKVASMSPKSHAFTSGIPPPAIRKRGPLNTTLKKHRSKITDWFLVQKDYRHKEGDIIVGAEVRGTVDTRMEGTVHTILGDYCSVLTFNRGIERVVEDVPIKELEIIDDEKDADRLIMYFSSASGNTQVKKYIDRMKYLLDHLRVRYTMIDISCDRKQREHMIEASQSQFKREIPQLFKGDMYLINWPEMQELHERDKLVGFFWRHARHVFKTVTT